MERRNCIAGLLVCVLVGTALIFTGCVRRSKAEIRETETEKNVTEKNVTEELPESEAEQEYLSDVQGLFAGTIVEKEKLDPNRWSDYFMIEEIREEIFGKINGKTYVENEHIGIEELRYLKVLHYNYDHQIQVGELIVNAEIAEDCKHIFTELFMQEYEIASMYLLEKYWTGDGVTTDTASIEENNSSAFNYRVVPGTNHLSNHARGYAIDLNPLQNPYVAYRSDGSFRTYYKDMEKYLDRNSGAAHMITHEDAAYQIFTKYGFTWGGDWKNSKDYQHFEKVANL